METSKRIREILPGILVVFSAFLIFYAYYMWIGCYAVKLLRFEIFWLDGFVPLYITAGFISFASGLMAIYKALKTQSSKLVKTVSSGSLMVLGGFLISYGYQLFRSYYALNYYPSIAEIIFSRHPWFRWWPLYFVAGFVSLGFGSIMTYRLLKTQPSRSVKGTLSAILLFTSSLLIFDAHLISVEYRARAHLIQEHPLAYDANSEGLRAAYQWLPLYIAVSTFYLAYGLVIAYKTFKTAKSSTDHIGKAMLTRSSNEGILHIAL